MIWHVLPLCITEPTYGELIDLFTEVEGRANTTDLLYSEFCTRYPKISVSRPTRLFDTVKPIVGPTRPSLRGAAKLSGSPLATYRKRVWKHRIRTSSTQGILEMVCYNNTVYHFIHFYIHSYI